MSEEELTAKVLDFLAGGWVSLDADRDWCRETAEAIRREDFSDSWCCPLCQEVECDTGCPLETARSAPLQQGEGT